MLPKIVGGADALFTGEHFEATVIRVEKNIEEIRALWELLSDTERRRADHFAFDRDRNRFIVARARLREMLATRLSVGRSRSN